MGEQGRAVDTRDHQSDKRLAGLIDLPAALAAASVSYYSFFSEGFQL